MRPGQSGNSVPDAFPLAAEDVIPILSIPERRRALWAAMQLESGTHLPLRNRFDEAAMHCNATAEQLHATIVALMKFKRRYEELIAPLVFHPNIAEHTLNLLYERDYCETALGHRSGPQEFLERIARERRYSEAITTLAKRYYGGTDYPTDAFADFIREHADDPMLRSNMLHAWGLPRDKQEVVRSVFGTREHPIKASAK